MTKNLYESAYYWKYIAVSSCEVNEHTVVIFIIHKELNCIISDVFLQCILEA